MSKTRRVPQRARAIRRLAKLRETFGPDTAAERERLLRACRGARCRSGKELSSLHETLCFARAYPDNRAVLDLVQDLLDRWERHGGGSSLRLARRMVSPAPDARLHPSVSFTIEPVSARDSLYFRETGFRGQRQRRRNSRPNSPIPLRRPSPRGAHRQFGAIRQPPGNCSKRWTAWWAREHPHSANK